MGAPAKTLDERLRRLHGLASDVLLPLGVAPLPDKPMLQPAATGPFDWVIMRLQDDPLYLKGHLGIPKRQQALLRDLDRRGVVFDELLIAHEIPKGSATEKDVHSGKALIAILTSFPPAPGPGVKALTGLLHGLAAATKTAAVVGAGALTTLGTFADPVLLGAMTADGTRAAGTLAGLFCITRW